MRPGVMAPPDLHEQSARPGLMRPATERPEPVELKVALWALAALIAAVELCVELVPG